MSVRLTGKSRRLRPESLETRRLLAADLRITEVNYHPHAALEEFGDRDADADEFEFVEIANLGDAATNLAGYRIDGGIEFHFAAQWLDPGDRLVVTKDVKDFRSRYGTNIPIALGNDGDDGDQGEYQGSLNNGGETLELRAPGGRTTQSFTYFDAGEWPKLADGQGSSLEAIDARLDLNDPKNWRASSEYGGSPGVAGEGWQSHVVINEILTHTDLPQIDTIELTNLSNEVVDLSGWYLTDTHEDIFRFQFSGPSAVLGSYDYRVYDEYQLGFSFRGQEADDVFLIEADVDGRPIRFADVVRFSATQNGVTLGRWEDGTGELFPMKYITWEDPNDEPLIGDVVISEVHYHPENPSPAVGLTETELEFVEVANRSLLTHDLSYWRLRDSVDFEFPSDTELEPEETIVMVGFDPQRSPAKATAFRDYYDMSPSVPLLGPYSDAADPNSDQLDDDGERLILERPEDIFQLGLGYVLVDRVTYSDTASWPQQADGGGQSLRRLELEGYGDFAETWIGSIPTPGAIGLLGDVNDDGQIDAVDIDEVCAASHQSAPDARYDLDADGSVSFADVQYLVGHILGTTPGDANLDGQFDSQDLVEAFIAGEYEDGVAANSGWATGDWNCDGEFNSDDLVTAFIAGGYNNSPAVPTAALHIAFEFDEPQNAVPSTPLIDSSDVPATSPQRHRTLESQSTDAVFAMEHQDLTDLTKGLHTEPTAGTSAVSQGLS